MVVHKKGHKNSKGEKAEWCIVSHETGKILSSHKSKAAAESHLTDMRKFKHMKEDFDSAKKFLEDKGYILLKEDTRLKARLKDVIRQMYVKGLINTYGDYTEAGKDLTEYKSNYRFNNFIPTTGQRLFYLVNGRLENSIDSIVKKIWIPYRSEGDDYTWHCHYCLIRDVGMQEIDNLIEYYDLNKEEESPIRLVGNDDMDYEI